MNPKYPIYIVSKGRWTSRLTAKALESMKVPYYIIVESTERDMYAAVIDPRKVLVLPQKYLDEYDTFWPRAIDNKTGPGAARNFCWDHSIENGFTWHWVMDDNIDAFCRLNFNLKIRCYTGSIFAACEDFVDRYENIYIAGLNYDFFCVQTEALPPYYPNTRIYSCLLIRNDIPYRWRGRYNEDTDLSLRVLKDGFCTIQFNAFLQYKAPTQTVPGGNTEEFYAKEGTLNKSQMLVDMHPDVTKLVFKFHRWHHHVDYRAFRKNKFILKSGITIPQGINEFGMVLRKVNPKNHNLRGPIC